MMANYSGIRIIDEGYPEYYCTRCNKLILESDSDFNWFTAFKLCKLCSTKKETIGDES